MSEKTQTNVPARPSAATPRTEGDLSIGDARRLDGPHEESPVQGPPEPAPGASLVISAPQKPSKSEELLLQASQFAEHLNSQFNELGRREQALISQLNQIDQERRNVRLWVQQFEDDVQQRDRTLHDAEDALEQRGSECEQRERDLGESQRELVSARSELEEERSRLRDELQRELETDRQLLQVQQADLESERKHLSDQIAENQSAHEQVLDECRQKLEADRARLDEEFAAEQETWQDECRNEREKLANERQTHDADLARERSAFESEHSQQTEQLQQERIVFENRMRFQQDHLVKARKEFELQQHEFRHEAQQKQSALEQSELLVLLRGTQLDHYRALLEEREQSVQREHELLAESRRMLEDSLGKNRRRLQSERETWEQERQAQRAEVRRQQDVLALHAENLEGRRSRLDQLRTELEETHRHTLEMRMAVEETCAQLAQSAGADVSQERIEIARRALSEHYSKLHEAVSRQQQETDEALVLFQKQKDEFRVERQTLTEWIAERDERIQLREEEVCRDAASLESREVEWRAAREVWMNEKLEAETVIRGLLQQLTVANDPNAATDT